MKKLLLSVPVVLGIVWAGSSWFVGQQTESELRHFIDRQNEQTAAEGIEQEVVSYEKGLFGAKAVTKLKVNKPPLDEMFGELQFVNDITNGPVFFGGGNPVQFGMARINTRLDTEALAEEKRQWVTTAFEGKQPFDAYSVLGFGGNTVSHVVLNPMKIDQDGATIVLEGAEIDGDTNADMMGKFTGHVGKLEVKEASSTFTMPSLDVTGDVAGVVGGQMLGSFEVRAPQVSVLAEGTTEPFVFDMNIQSNSDVKDGAAEGKVKLLLDNVKGSNDVLSKLDYSLDFQGLDVEGLKAVNQLQVEMANMQSQMDWNGEAMETPEGQQKMQELMANISQKSEQMVGAIFSKLLKTDKSRMHHVLMAESPKGKLNADIDLTYTGQGSPGMMELVSYGPNDWAKMMKGKIMLDTDQAMLPEGFDMLVMPYMEQGLIAQDGDKLKTSIELAGENVTLNGKQMSFADLVQMLAPAGAGEGMMGEGADADLGIPEDLMQKIQQEGLTPEVIQLLEESDDVPPETVEMFKQLQQIQQDVQEGKLPEEEGKQ